MMTPNSLVSQQLARMAQDVWSDNRPSRIKVLDLDVQCMASVRRDAEGRIRDVSTPHFDAVRIAPDYSWRCGKFDEVVFSGGHVDMHRALLAYVAARS